MWIGCIVCKSRIYNIAKKSNLTARKLRSRKNNANENTFKIKKKTCCTKK